MPLKITTVAASSRAATEDRLAVFPCRDGAVVVVADGTGGAAGGGRAADLAVKSVGAALEHGTFDPSSADRWVEVLAEADATLASDRGAGETTIVVVAITEHGSVAGASCGDSGAVIVTTRGGLDDLTEKQHRKRRLGSGRALPVPFWRPRFDGTLLVATDGLLSYAALEGIAHLAAEHDDLDALGRALVRAVTLSNGTLQDDLAIVLVR
jgi:serine/threonine protein phosphatase PrpC